MAKKDKKEIDSDSLEGLTDLELFNKHVKNNTFGGRDGQFILNLFQYQRYLKEVEEVCRRNDEYVEKTYKKHKDISKTLSTKYYEKLLQNFLSKHQDKKISDELILKFFERVYKIPVVPYKVTSFIYGIDFNVESISLGNFKLIKKTLEEIKKDYEEGLNLTSIIEHHKHHELNEIHYVIEYESLKLRINEKGSVKDMVSSYALERHNKYVDDFMLLLYYLGGKRSKYTVSKYPIPKSKLQTTYLRNLTSDAPAANIKQEKVEILDLSGQGKDNVLGVEYHKDLFYLIDKERKGLEMNIYNAIMWAGKSLMDSDLERAFVQLFIGLENVSLRGIPNSASALMTGYFKETSSANENKENLINEKTRVKEIVKYFKNIRNKIVHQNDSKNINLSEEYRCRLLGFIKEQGSDADNASSAYYAHLLDISKKHKADFLNVSKNDYAFLLNILKKITYYICQDKDLETYKDLKARAKRLNEEYRY